MVRNGMRDRNMLNDQNDEDESDSDEENDILIKVDGNSFNNEDFRFIQNFAEIIANDKELGVGTFQLGNLQITINSLETYEKELIKCKKYQ